MHYIRGMLNPNVVWELSNRFGWVNKHPMGLNQLDFNQKQYAVQLNRSYVVTLKGIMTLKDFSFLWVQGNNSPTLLYKLPNVYNSLINEIEERQWKIMGNKKERIVKLSYDPYTNLVTVHTEPKTYKEILETKFSNIYIYKSYLLQDINMLIENLNTLHEDHNDFLYVL